MSSIKALWREPLVHFLLIGAVLFALFELRQDDESAAPNRILVDAGQVERIVARFERLWLRPPTDAELAGLIESHVRDEVYYREARALGLNRDDPVVRQRMRLKLEFLQEELAAAEAPGDEELARFLHQKPDRFQREPRLSFSHVFLNPGKHPDMAGDSRAMLARLKNGAPPETEGDRTLLEPAYEQAAQSEIARVFGQAFAQQLVALAPGGWTGPISSGYGSHLVKVAAKQEGHTPALAEIRDEVEREYMAERRKALKDASYRRLREGYEIVIEPTTHAAGQATVSMADQAEQ